MLIFFGTNLVKIHMFDFQKSYKHYILVLENTAHEREQLKKNINLQSWV
jgi:hypothetical protein